MQVANAATLTTIYLGLVLAIWFGIDSWVAYQVDKRVAVILAKTEKIKAEEIKAEKPIEEINANCAYLQELRQLNLQVAEIIRANKK